MKSSFLWASVRNAQPNSPLSHHGLHWHVQTCQPCAGVSMCLGRMSRRMFLRWPSVLGYQVRTIDIAPLEGEHDHDGIATCSHSPRSCVLHSWLLVYGLLVTARWRRSILRCQTPATHQRGTLLHPNSISRAKASSSTTKTSASIDLHTTKISYEHLLLLP